jgi:uncharacterized delta-60 repeat protein
MLLAATAVHAQVPDAFNPGANNGIFAIAFQPDGKILVGGSFSQIGGGGSGSVMLNRLARLNPDGSVDGTFNPGANGRVHAIAVQPDGKIVVAGLFTTIGGGGAGNVARRKIARLNADGSVDMGFDPGTNSGDPSVGGIFALVVQPDGKIVVGGNFTGLGGGTGTTERRYVGRLLADGQLDMGFNPGCDNNVLAVALQPDGKVLVGGLFANLGGGGAGDTPRNNIGRLNSDGAVDMAFNPGASGGVQGFIVQPDGRILVGGGFVSIGGGGGGSTAYDFIARLESNGVVDLSFHPDPNGSVESMARQVDGRIVIVGGFSRLGGTSGPVRNSIGRLLNDGSVDATFNPDSNGTLDAVAMQSDGRLVIGGSFSRIGGAGVNGVNRQAIARLMNNGTATSRVSIDPDGSAVQWTRGGTAPDVWRVTFESTPDGVNYTMLGAGSRISNGWRLTGLSLPPGVRIRARGFVQAGKWNGGESIIDSELSLVNAPFDFDGDLRSDRSVFRPTGGIWYSLLTTGGFTGTQFGVSSDVDTPGDIDADGRTDIAVFRANVGAWYWRRSFNGLISSFPFGQDGDVPFLSDTDGDGRADFIVWRPSTGIFYAQQTTAGFTAIQFGTLGDIPMVSDFDGDGRADFAVWRPSDGIWYVNRSTGGFSATNWGAGSFGDVPHLGDFDGDGQTEFTIWRPSDGTFWILTSTGLISAVSWGAGAFNDVPVSGDWDADGRTDIAVWRPGDGVWYSRLSGGGFAFVQFGANGDRPIGHRQ